MEKEIRLYGPLAKFVGQRKIMAEISSAGEAIRMLLVNFPGLERHMADQYYKVIVDGIESDLEQINYPASQTIKIVPVLGGAGGVGKIILGVALVATAIVLGPVGGGFLGLGMGVGGGVGFGALGTVASSIIGAVGAALVLGGTSQLLSPTPQIGQIGPASMNPGGGRSTTSEGTEMDPQESYSFSGIQQVSRQGVPVPIVYGETIVGSVVISSAILTKDVIS